MTKAIPPGTAIHPSVSTCCTNQNCQPGDCQPVYDNRTGSMLGFSALPDKKDGKNAHWVNCR